MRESTLQLRIIVTMKAIATVIVLCASLLANAQTPAHHAKPSAAHASGAVGMRSSLLNPASLTAKAPAVYKVEFTTTAGDFVVEVHRDWAPIGANRFYNLVRSGYFTNAAFFRVVPGFIVQFGLSANPAVNKAWENAKIHDDPVVQSNKRGSIVFATSGRNTRTTQLFINYGDNAGLDGKGFAPFGTVVDGMEDVDNIFSGYHESPDQKLITSQGDTYLKARFPRMDKIKQARILPAVSSAPAGSKTATELSPKSAAKPAQH
jgi:peptidyl-prolyl cis-trans isomerase A (cyclophilin A)